MQWPPPRPRPSSAPTMVMTSMGAEWLDSAPRLSPVYYGLPSVMTPLMAAVVTPAPAHAVGSGGWKNS
jgi:hypothetical protein